MDPDACLSKMLDLATRIIRQLDDGTPIGELSTYDVASLAKRDMWTLLIRKAPIGIRYAGADCRHG